MISINATGVADTRGFQATKLKIQTTKIMVIAEIEEVFLKYKSQDEKIEKILQHKDTKIKISTTHFNFGNFPLVKLTLEEAKNRNQSILKELEFVKGNLRSKAIFSPTELQWEKVCQEYQKRPSLTVTTWYCQLPVFV